IDSAFRGVLDDTACARAQESSRACESETTTVQGGTALAVNKTDDPDPATAGGPITYTITVTNTGPSSATGINVTDVVPAPVSIGGASGPGPCTVVGQEVSCTIAALAVHLRCTAAAADGTIAIAIADDGHGLPPRARENLFRP